MHLASSCSVALQHCGQFVSERVVTTMTALVVGTAAMGVATAPSGDAGLKKAERDERVGIEVAEVLPKRVTKKARARTLPVPQETATGTRPEQDPPPAAAPEPQPQPTTSPTSAPAQPQPTASPTSAPPSGGAQPTTGGAQPAAGPAPLYTYFGWKSDEPIARAQATSSTVAMDCTKGSATHEVRTSISHGSSVYPMSMRFDISVSNARMAFSVRVDGRDVLYSSWGAEPIAKWVREGSNMRVGISGEYGPLYGSDAESAKLPKSGAFDATLTLDCAAQSVVTEGAVFTTE